MSSLALLGAAVVGEPGGFRLPSGFTDSLDAPSGHDVTRIETVAARPLGLDRQYGYIEFFQFESLNFPGWFIRHRNFYGELSRQAVGDPLGDFSFKLAPRGSGRVALTPMNFPRYYLRHKNFRIFLEKSNGPADQLFLRDSKFYLESNRFGRGGISFRSLNYPGRYLRHRNFQLWIEPLNSVNLGADATFFQKVRID